ncbi:hypothetical protein FNV43_RR05278 [Rhamnella rubrinervis]|uniref:Nodulin-like domain-containing protein n=1 Tax=Rhamnella rubrinervis TaxID=2594499 RepID=A0A8K0HNF4_9ROSA|nr:hypothetical protein FNV43_RR05278 [Rhamnella rubrinervis]
MPPTALQWLSLVGVVWLQSISGTNTNFPAYSSQLKQVLSMSQLQLNNLAFASDAGKLLGWFSGIAAVYLPLWLVLIIGSALGLIGYGVQYLSLIDQIPSLSYVQIFALTVLAGHSICWINTVSYVVSIRNFPCNQQVVVGLTTSYQGLSAKIYTDIVDAVFSHSLFERAEAYLLVNSALPLIVCFIVAPLVKDIDVSGQRNVDAGFKVMFVITIVTGIYSIISSLESISGGMSALDNLIGTGVLLLAPLVIPLAEKLREKVPTKSNINGETKVCSFTVEDQNDGTVRSVEEGFKEGEEEADREVQVRDVGVREEIGARTMLMRIDFWLYFLVYFSGATLGMVFLNNLGQIAESRGSSRTSSLVSLCSSFGFFGRLMPSFLDYYISRSKHMVSRPGLIVLSMVPMAGAFFLLLSPTNISLYIGTAIIGVCSGAITSIAVTTTRELFGTENFSVNHNIVVANIPLGSLIFGYMAAMLYRKEGNRDGKCMGLKCYRNNFVIWGCVCILGIILAIILYARTRKFYLKRHDHHETQLAAALTAVHPTSRATPPGMPANVSSSPTSTRPADAGSFRIGLKPDPTLSPPFAGFRRVFRRKEGAFLVVSTPEFDCDVLYS